MSKTGSAQNEYRITYILLPERMVAMDDLGLDDLQKRPLYHDPFFPSSIKVNQDHLDHLVDVG